MEGLAGPAAIDSGGQEEEERRRRRRRRLRFAGIGLVVVCAAAAVGLGIGLRHDRGAIGRPSSYPVPSGFTTAGDSGTKIVAEAEAKSPLIIGGGSTGSTGTSSGQAGGITDTNGALAAILAAASSTAAGAGGALAPPSGPGEEAPPPDAPAFQSLQGRLSSGALGLRTCYPANGSQVVQMSSGSHPCTVLILTKSSQDYYAIRQTINITTPKIYIGNPIDPPVLNATRIERLFDGASPPLSFLGIHLLPRRVH